MYVATYNGITLQNDANHVINKFDGIDGLDVRISGDPLTGRDGGNIWEEMYDMRTIEIGGHVFADDSATYYTLRRAMLNAFTPKVNRELLVTLSDGSIVGIMAKVTGTPQFKEVEGEKDSAEFQVILKAQDPFFYSTTVNSATLIPSVIGGTPVSSPVASPVGGTGSTATVITNTGDVEFYATVTFSGAVTNPTLTNTSNGQYFTIATSILSGQQVQIYKDTTGIYIKDVTTGTSYMQYFRGTFFSFPVGATSLAFSALTTTPDSTCTVTWQNKYLGY